MRQDSVVNHGAEVLTHNIEKGFWSYEPVEMGANSSLGEGINSISTNLNSCVRVHNIVISICN